MEYKVRNVFKKTDEKPRNIMRNTRVRVDTQNKQTIVVIYLQVPLERREIIFGKRNFGVIPVNLEGIQKFATGIYAVQVANVVSIFILTPLPSSVLQRHVGIAQ